MVANVQEKLKNTNTYLLIFLAFSIPLSTALPFIISAIIFINWLCINEFRDDWNRVKSNAVVISILLFLLFMIIALLWSQDPQHGLLFTLKKEAKLILIPIFMLFITPKHSKTYFIAFLLGMSISELFTYLVFLKIIHPFMNSSTYHPAPFLSHITYSPIIAFAIYLLLQLVLFSKELSRLKTIVYVLFALTMTFNLFISGGRAGQVMFFGVIFLLFVQYFHRHKIIATALSLLSIILMSTLFYSAIPTFKHRVDLIFSDISRFDKNRDTSLGQRLTFAINSSEIIRDNPIFGVGTGGFKENYARINQINSPQISPTLNPHNMYIFVLVEFGVVGLILFLSIFFFQIKYALLQKDIVMKNIGIAFPLLFLLIMFSESYLLIPSTLFLFIFFSSILYTNPLTTKLKEPQLHYKYNINTTALVSIEDIVNIQTTFNSSQQSMHKARNEIKIIEIDKRQYVVKSFKKPHFVNKIVYSFFRTSKAQRSYDNSLMLQDFAPTPIAYIEFYEASLLAQSYFISEYYPYDFTMKPPLLDPHFPDRNALLEAFTNFTYELHQNKIFHIDYSPGNILVKKIQGAYQFKIVDVNRMRFFILTNSDRAKNFAKLTSNLEDIKKIADFYTKKMPSLNNFFDQIVACIVKHTRVKKIKKSMKAFVRKNRQSNA
jgi:O-antigen ligase